MTISGNARRLRSIIKRDGFRVAARKVLARLGAQAPVGTLGAADVIRHYEFILGEEQGAGQPANAQSLHEGSMTWLIPDFDAQSGGHINILRMMALLKERGFVKQHVVIMEPYIWSSTTEAQAALNKAFGDHGITVSLGARSIEPCTYLVATGWQTAYWVAKYKDALHRLYFVQDFEPFFYAQGSEYSFAENTYRLGLTGITAGTWLADKLAREYGMTTFPYSFSCDKELYRPRPRREDGKKRIFFYARPVTPRRCFEMGLLALKKVCEAKPDVSVVFAGWDTGGYEIPFPHTGHGAVSVKDLPDLYSQCDAALILSSTNLSLLPLEVAACGCPVVLNTGPHAEWLLSEDQAAYCDMSVESISAAIIDTLDHPEKTRKRVDAAFDYAQKTSWADEADKVAGFLKSLGSEQGADCWPKPDAGHVSG